MKKFLYSILVLILGFLFSAVGGLFAGGEAPVTNGAFNSAMHMLVFSIIFLCSIIVFCTLKVIEELKKVSN